MQQDTARVGDVQKTSADKNQNFNVNSETRPNYMQDAPLYTPAGVSAPPLPEDRVLLVKTEGTGKFAVVGFLGYTQGAEPGELFLYSRDDERKVQAIVRLKKDGKIEVFAPDSISVENKNFIDVKTESTINVEAKDAISVKTEKTASLEAKEAISAETKETATLKSQKDTTVSVNDGLVTVVLGENGKIAINAPSGIDIATPQITVTGGITTGSDVVAGGISLQKHTHTGVHGETSPAH